MEHLTEVSRLPLSPAFVSKRNLFCQVVNRDGSTMSAVLVPEIQQMGKEGYSQNRILLATTKDLILFLDLKELYIIEMVFFITV